MKFKKILLSLLTCLSCFVQAKNITISRLTCEMQEGLVVVEGSPRLGWVMESPEMGHDNLPMRLTFGRLLQGVPFGIVGRFILRRVS